MPEPKAVPATNVYRSNCFGFSRWYHDVRKVTWRSPADVKRVYANASIVGENRIVFNIGGSKYRLVVAVNYPYRMCYVRFVGTHQAYDRIDVATV